MNQMFRLCALGLTLAACGCGAGTPELGAAKETPKPDQAAIQKAMEESMKRNNAGPNASQQVELPAGGENKAQ